MAQPSLPVNRIELMNQLQHIERVLAGSTPLRLAHPEATRAAVAMILCGSPESPEALFIERARHERDPWSGDIGLPGGKLEPEDAGPRQAAERETAEEIGLDLSGARCLGQLDDLAGAHLPVVISCFVYRLSPLPELTLSREVERAFRVPLEELFASRHQVETVVFFRGEELLRPAIRLPVFGHNILWGITYRLVRRFREMLDNPRG